MNTTDTYLALSVPFYSPRQEDLSLCFNPLNNLFWTVNFIPFYVLNLTCIEQFFFWISSVRTFTARLLAMLLL